MRPEQTSSRSEPNANDSERAPSGQIAAFPDFAKRTAPREKPKRQAVLVAGMHRSGTSALTEALSLLGGRLPAHPLPPLPANPRGYFEPRDIVQIHDRILASAGSSWADWDRFPESWYETLDAASFVRELADAVRAEYGNAHILLLKDPRICRLLPLWRRVLAELDLEPIIVLPFRNPLETAASLRKREGFSLAQGYLLWLRHVLDAELMSRDFPRAFLRYGDLLAEPRREIARLEEQIPVVWPRKSARAYHQIEKALENDLRHEAAADELTSRHDVSNWLRVTYEGYKALCGSPVDKQVLQKLDRVRFEFNQACQAFAPAFQGLQIRVEEQSDALLRLRQELVAAEEKAATLEPLPARIAELEAALAELRRTEQERNAWSDELSEELERQASRTRGENEDLRKQIAELSNELAAERAKVAELSPLISQVSELEAALIKAAERATRMEEVASRVADLERQVWESRQDAERLRERANLNPQFQEMLHASKAELQKMTQAVQRSAAKAARAHERVQLLEHAIHESIHPLPHARSGLARLLRYAYWAITLQLPRQYRAEERLKKRVRLAMQSELFDCEWYLKAHPDIAAARIDPAQHYCTIGFLEGRAPGPKADHSSAIALARQLQAT